MICISISSENFAQTQSVFQGFDTLSKDLPQLREQLQLNGFFFETLSHQILMSCPESLLSKDFLLNESQKILFG
jgi:hypothetical protein